MELIQEQPHNGNVTHPSSIMENSYTFLCREGGWRDRGREGEREGGGRQDEAREGEREGGGRQEGPGQGETEGQRKGRREERREGRREGNVTEKMTISAQVHTSQPTSNIHKQNKCDLP